MEINDFVARHLADRGNVTGASEGNAIRMVFTEQDWRQRAECDALRISQFGLDARQLLTAQPLDFSRDEIRL